MKIIPRKTCYDGENIWIQSAEINAIFKADTLNSFHIDYVGTLMESYSPDSWLLSKSVSLEDKVLMFSNKMYEVWIYDKITKEFEHRVLKKTPFKDECCIGLCGECAWIIPRTFSEIIVKYDIKHGTYTDIPWNKPEWIGLDEGRITDVIACGKSLFFATRKFNEIMLIVIDTVNEKIESIELNELECISSIYSQSNEVKIFGKSKDNRTIILGIDKNKELGEDVEIKNIAYSNNRDLDVQYNKVFQLENNMIFIPHHAKDVWIYDSRRDEIKQLLYPMEISNALSDRNALFIDGYSNSNKIYLLSCLIPYILCYDVEKEQFSTFEINIDIEEKQLVKCLEEGNKNNGVYLEGHILNLQLLIESLCEK